ncbi:MAG: hypothetical protein CO133_01320, partial [Candidatus Komeilibacteria bacterium CG_4_9_14_3_um_filter_37_5]
DISTCDTKEGKEILAEYQVEDLRKFRIQYQELVELTDSNKELIDWLSFSFNKNQDIKDCVLEQIKMHKSPYLHIKLNYLMLKFHNLIAEFQQTITVNEKTSDYINNDIDRRQNDLSELKNKINEAISFFLPKNFGNIKEYVYLPHNPLMKSQSGFGMHLGETYYIMSDHNNRVNEVHEFLHSIINPITEKIKLTEVEKRSILEFSTEKTKEHYEFAASILNETLIRSYRTGFNVENQPTFESFKKILLSTPRNIIIEILAREHGSPITDNIDELLNDESITRQYYDKYVRDKFKDKVWEFYKSYQAEINQNNTQSFEDYFLQNYKSIFE